MLRTICPQCKKPVHLDESLLGTMVSCPGCGQPMRLPPKPVPAKPSDLESNVQRAMASAGPPLSADTPIDTGWEVPGAKPEPAEVANATSPRPALPDASTTSTASENRPSRWRAAIVIVILALAAVILGYIAIIGGH